MLEPTRITPMGLVGDGAGDRLNVRDFALARRANGAAQIVSVLSVGTSMNAGKTLAATSMLHGLKAAGFRVAGIKATGTGSGGDLWIMQDAGADVVLDFTDAGFASTYLAPVAELEAATLQLIGHAAALGCDVAVIEIADGLQQLETAALIRSTPIRQAVAGVIFSAYDAMGAKFGVDTLQAAGHRVIALSGRLAQSPLGVREAESATGLRVYTPWELQAGALVADVMGDRSISGGNKAWARPLAVVRPEAGYQSSAEAESGPAVAPSNRPPAQWPTFAGVAGLDMPKLTERARAIWVRCNRVADDALRRIEWLRGFAVHIGRVGTDKLAHAFLATAGPRRLAERTRRFEQTVEIGVAQSELPGRIELRDAQRAGQSFDRTSSRAYLIAGPVPVWSGPDEVPAFEGDATADSDDGPFHEWALPSQGQRSDYAKAS